ncbi:MAG: hypothetical protein EOO88_07710 [Pedobacter sp.]|nr:MAG: hypothetical protein EOO88_07710 [Pedobacter sp.]
MKTITAKLLSTTAITLSIIGITLTGPGQVRAQAKTAQYKWTGTWHFTRTSNGDGVTALDIKIGNNVLLPNNQAYGQAIFNVTNKFPGSAPWSTLAVGELSKLIPTAKSLSEKDQEAYLNYMDKIGVQVFIELFPFKQQDVLKDISQWLTKYKHHKCVAGVGIELEYFGKATDSLAKAWNEKIKSYSPTYRMFLRHYDPSFMPPIYRGSGDLIFIDDASEGLLEELNKGFADWANRFSPTAVAFQIGYPADEDGMNGSNELGWWKLKDPIKEWGSAILPLIKNPDQELGLIWVTVKSGKTYHKTWDLTTGAKMPATKK